MAQETTDLVHAFYDDDDDDDDDDDEYNRQLPGKMVMRSYRKVFTNKSG